MAIVSVRRPGFGPRRLAANPRVQVHFTPGLGVVDEPGLEVWFGNIERQAIRSGAFCSVKDPNVKIPALTGNWNDRGHPSSEPRPPTRSSVRGEPSKDFELTPLK